MKYLGGILVGVAVLAFVWPLIVASTPKTAAVAPFMGVMALALGAALIVADLIVKKK